MRHQNLLFPFTFQPAIPPFLPMFANEKHSWSLKVQLYFKTNPSRQWLSQRCFAPHFLCENERQRSSCVKTFHLLCHVEALSHFSAETSPICRGAAVLTLTHANSLGCATLSGPAAAGQESCSRCRQTFRSFCFLWVWSPVSSYSWLFKETRAVVSGCKVVYSMNASVLQVRSSEC